MRTSYLVVTSSILIALIIVSLSVAIRVDLNTASAASIDTVDELPAVQLVSLPAQEIASSSALQAPATTTIATTADPASAKEPVKEPPKERAVQKPAHIPAQESAQKPAKQPTLGTQAQYPERLVIPSINMHVPIVPVGVNDKGEMDVPSGASANVGWYKGGPMPGSIGSAVLDAHVFAAFEDLRYVKVGSFIYIETIGGTKLRFKVVDSRVYALSELTSSMLFGQKDARRLNLITCAGTYVSGIDTYDHRLVVYTIFDGEET